MADNDEVFAFRAPQYLKYLCKGLEINYGETCRKVLLELCGIPPEGNGPSSARVSPDVWDKAEFTINFEIKQLQLLLSQIQQLRKLPPAIQSIAHNSVQQSCTNRPFVQQSCTEKTAKQSIAKPTKDKPFDIGVIGWLVHYLMSDREILSYYEPLDNGEDITDRLTDCWIELRERAGEDHDETFISIRDYGEVSLKDAIKYIDSIDIPVPITDLLGSVLLDHGESIADRQADEQEEAEA